MAKNSRQDLEKQFGNGIAPISTKNSKKTTKKVETKKKTKKEDKKKKKKKSTPESTKLSELVKSIDSGSDIAKNYDTEEYNKQYNSLSKKQKAQANEAAAKSLYDNKKWDFEGSLQKAHEESWPTISKSFDTQLKRQKELTFNPSMEDRMNIKENYGVSSEKNPYSKNYDKTVRENALSKETKEALNKNRNELVLTEYLKNYYEQENQNPSVAEKILSPLTQAGTLFTGVAKLGGYNTYKDSKGLVHYLPDKLDLNYEKNKEKIDNKFLKWGYDTAGEATKIIASSLLNIPTAGTAGTAMYWGSMAGNNVGEATNKLTAKGEKRYDKVILNAGLKTALEYVTGKFLGSATKGLTGGKTSELESGLTSGLYDFFDKTKLPENIKFKLAKGIATRGSEGLEEFIQNPLESMIDILTIGDDGKHDNIIDMLTDIDTWKDAFKAFASGAAVAGLVEDFNVVTNPGYYTEGAMEMQKSKKSKNVQKIIDAEVENRIETEYNGQVTAKEAQQIQNEVIEDIEKGYISTETIEKTLGGETYSKLESINQEKNKIQTQIDELQKKADNNELSSLEEKQKLNDLNEQIKTIDDTEIRNQLNKEIQETIKNDTGLQESYKELERRKEYYNVDLSKVQNEAARQTYQNAINSHSNNTNRFHSFVDMMAKISEDKGIVFDFTNNEKLAQSGFGLQGQVFEVRDSNGKLINEFKTEQEARNFINKSNNSYNIEEVFKNINGYESKNGIVINLNSNRAINRVVGHELTHTFEGTKLYTELQDSLKEFIGESRWNEIVEEYKERYKDYSNAELENEIISDFIGDYLFTDENYVRSLSTKHKNIFDIVYDEIKYLYNIATAGSKEQRQIAKAKKIFDKLYNETKSRTNKDTKMALDRDTYKEVNVESLDVLNEARNYIKENKLNGLDGGSLDEFISDFQEKNNLYNAGTEIRNIIEENYLNLASSIEKNSKIEYNNNGIELDPTEKNIVTSAINTDTPTLDNGKHIKYYGNNMYLFNKTNFNEYDFVGKFNIEYMKDNNLEVDLDELDKDFNGYVKDFYEREGRYQGNNSIVENRQSEERNDKLVNRKQEQQLEYRQDNNSSIEDSTLRELDNSSLLNGKKFAISRETGKLQENGNDVTLETTPVGNTGTLMAIHNLNEEKANGVLDLGGFPYPSIAITNPSKLSHEGYGDISVLFNKDTINPESNPKNKVYSRDAYTPRFPKVEYKLNNNEISKLRKTIGDYDYRNAQPGDNYISDARSIIDNLEDNINRSGIDKTLDDIKNSDAMKYVYIKNTNPNFKVETKNEQFSNIYSNETLQRFLDNYDGKYELNDIPSNEVDNYTKPMVDAYKQQLQEEYDNPEIIQIQIKNLEDRFASKDNFLRAAYKLQKYGIEHQVLDTVATKEKINNSINQEDYNKWVDNQFKDIIEKKGLRNNKDYYTSSGTPRSFEQLHDDYTLDNVVKILDALDSTGAEGGMFTGVGEIAGNASVRFNNIEDIKANENLLTEIGNEEYGKMIEDIQDRLSNIEESIMDRGHNNSDNYFIARDNLSSAIADAARLYGENKKVDANRVSKILNEYGFSPNNTESQQIVDMFSELRQLPTQYFEAKPKRAVGLDETEQWVIPNTSSNEFKQRLQDLGLQYTEYDPSIEGDRQRVINQFDNLKFSVDRIPISKNFLTESEQNELDGLRALDNSGWTELTPEEQSRMQQLENKADVVLDKKAEKMLRSASYKAINTTTKVAENYLDFDAKQKKDFRNQMREFSNMTKDELVGADTYNKVKDIVSQYANREYTYFDDTVEGIKRELKHTKIRVTDEMKNQITDYGYFVRDSKLMLRRNSGTPVDQVYQEYSEMYPNFFDADVWNEADELERLNEFMNHDFSVTEKYRLSDDDLRVATDIIYNKLLDNSLSQQDLIETEEILDKKVQKRTRTVVREELLDKMGITPELISEGNDISAINFARTDPIRVNEKVFGWKTGQLINDATVNFTKHQEAERTRFLNKERQEIKDLGIKARSKESELVQKYGEKQYVDKNNEVHPYTDAELNRDVKDVATREKIKNAARVLRQKYDTYIDKVNSVLTEMGYDEIPKRQDYMRHFVELDDKFSRWGLPFNKESMMAEDLPTDINGLTEFNRPGKSYFASANTRTGLQTTYDAITGIDGYLEGVSNLIYHTESIQRYRALTRFIRENYGREHGLDNIDLMTDEELAERIKDIQDNKLSKYVAWLDEQANSIAGKKGSLDRSVERMFGRRVYTALNTLKSQVGSNMTGFNVRSAMTNFASAIQGMSKTQKLAFVKGTVSTINNIIHDDGMIEKSDFLTRRLLDTQSLALKSWQKISQAGQVFMNGTDYFTANQIWRGKYYENLSKGMSEQQAIKNADDFAARIMGDRSKGSTAELFNSKTLGFLSQFQLEVNNQWSSLIHDNKIDIQKGNKTALGVTFELGQLFAASYLFNTLMKELTGSDVMIDPIDMLLKIFKPDDDDKDEGIVKRAQKVLGELINNLPFANLITGGGRIPISEAFTGVKTLGNKLIGGTDNYGNEITWGDVKDDALESLAYWVLPTGYGQLRKTVKGLSMYDDKLPIAGSYTDSGNLRFSAEDNAYGKVKAGLFGQYSSRYAQDYIDSGYKSINASKLDEMKDLDMNSTEYRDYREGLSAAGTSIEDKLNYISDLDVSDEDKTIMASNVAKKDIDMSEYKKYGSYDEFNYAQKNPTKYEVMKLVGGYDTYKNYEKAISEITADYDRNGKAITNSRKNKVIKYVNSLNLTRAQKAMLIKEQYPSFTQYDSQIASYVNNQNMSFIQKAGILKQLGFKAYDRQIINYIRENYRTVEEQQEELEKLGFKIYNYNGKTYVR